MSTYTEYDHRFVLEQPATFEEIADAYDQAVKRWNEKNWSLWVIGWWEVWNWGEGIGRGPAYIAYPHTHYYVQNYKDGWMLTENRGHWLRPLPANCTAYRAIQGLALEHEHKQYLRTIPLERLEPGSPIGYGPTRKFPMQDIVTDGYTLNPDEYIEHSQTSPDPQVIKNLQRTPHGAILWQPDHSRQIDRVWYHLAREHGIQAEKDIEAYAIGWWQERSWKHSSTGAMYLAFDTPQRLWGFHHPPGMPKASWIYWYDWYRDMKPLPQAAGKANWAVEYVFKGQQPTLQQIDLVSQVPQRNVKGIKRDERLNDAQIAAVGGSLSQVNDQGKTLLKQPIRVLAGLFWEEDCDAIARRAWECAEWITNNPVANEPWPVAVRRHHQWRWEHGKYVD